MTKEEVAAQRRLKMLVKELQRVISSKDREIATIRHNARVRLPESEAAFICCGRRLPEPGSAKEGSA